MASKKHTASAHVTPFPAPVVVILGGLERTLEFTFAALMALGDLGYNMLDPTEWVRILKLQFDVVEENGKKTTKIKSLAPSPRVVRDLTFAALREHHAELTMEQVQRMLPTHPDALVDLLGKLLEARAQQAEPAGENKQRPTEAGEKPASH